MKMLVMGEGKEDFVKELKEIIETQDSKECILVEINDDVVVDSTLYMTLLNKIDKPVTYGILK